MSLRTLAVIPARYASTRLPGKPLLRIAGIPLILRVLRGVRRCAAVDRVVVATDDQRIADVVTDDGGEAVMTPSDLPSGGDRVAYVARRIPSEYVINVQGDDPLVDADMIDPLVDALEADPSTRLALLAKKIDQRSEVDNPNVVKVVFDAQGRALYFSRSPIPYPRNAENAVWYKHIGPYGWRRDFLLEFAEMEQTPLEKTESLEMLRVLEKGYRLRCVPTARDTIEIDTPDDVRRLEDWLAREQH
ncbi:MAG: 3-deoxy-manno-octulosonate cytidylyltransferase [Pyramidobacter sp.]